MSSEIGEISGENDKVTFGVSLPGQDVLDGLMRMKYFKSELGAFQAAASLAMSLDLPAREVTAANGTKWNRGSVDPQMLSFFEWYLATPTPVRQLERLGNVGLAHIADKVSTGGYTFSELFQLPKDLDG
jgi:hypothetical protein